MHCLYFSYLEKNSNLWTDLRIHLKKFFYSYVHTKFGSFLPPSPLPLPFPYLLPLPPYLLTTSQKQFCSYL
jgi:hypothetical protein